MTHYLENSVNGGITLTNVFGDTLIYTKTLTFVYTKKFGSRIMMVYLLVNMGGG